MIDYQDLQLSLRARLDTMVVATTGSITMSVAGSVISRPSGSFLDDKFHAGMEIIGNVMQDPLNNAPSTIREASDSALTVDRTLETEPAISGKTLQVVAPSRKAWENFEFESSQGDPYFEEQLVPGTSAQFTVGPGGWMEYLPLYVLLVHVPTQVGIGAHNRYADAILQHFAPRFSISLSNGDVAVVRADVSPFRGQAQNLKKGWVVVAVTIPLRYFTINP